MKTLAISLLLLTSCSGQHGMQAKGFSGHASVSKIDTNKVVCNADAAGSGYEDALEAAKNAPKY